MTLTLSHFKGSDVVGIVESFTFSEARKNPLRVHPVRGGMFIEAGVIGGAMCATAKLG